MSAETIKEFLVGLKFGVDKASLEKFTEGVKGAAVQAAALGTAITAAAAAVVAQTALMAAQMEKLYYASKRTGATVAGMQSLGYAASQLGSSAQAAQGSLENLGDFIRSNPGGRGFLKSMGIDANEARDTSDIMTDIGAKMKQMADRGQYAQAKVYGSFLGLDEDTMRAMMSGEFTSFMAQYKDMVRQTGVNLDEAAASSRTFMQQLRGTQTVFKLLWDSVSVALIKNLAPMLERLRNVIMANFSTLSKVFSGIGSGTVKVAAIILGVLVHGAELAFKALSALDRATGGWSTKILGLVAAWRALNLAFTLTPIGAVVTAVVALAGALVMLWDDYSVWREGGKSLFNWGEWDGEIQEAIKGFQELGVTIAELGQALWKAIGPTANELWSVAKVVLGEVLHIILDLVRITTDLLLGKWDDAWDLAGDAVRRMGNIVNVTFDLLQGWISQFVDWLGRVLGPQVKQYLDVMTANFKEAVAIVIDLIRFVANLLTGQWSDAWADAADVGKRFVNIFQNTFELFKTWFTEFVNWFLGKFGSISGALDKVAGVASKIKTGAGKVAGAVASGAKQATSWVAKKMGIKTTEEQNAAAKESYDYWISKGYTPEQAAGMVANEQRESSFNEKATGDNGQAQGIFQWHKARRDAIKAATGIDISNASHKQQLEAAYYEMTQGSEKAAGDAIKAAKTAGEAGAVMSQKYERPADRQGEMDTRAGMAEAWNAKFASMNAARLAPSQPQLEAANNNAPATATITQKTDIIIQGSSDPQATAGAVAQAQGAVNSSLVRNTKGAIA